MSIIEELLSASPPDVLYHYTSQEGLLGIVEKRELWATRAIYMNDEVEFSLALSLARKTIESRTIDEDLKADLLYEIDTIEKVHIFVCSFSAKADLLSQWRGYCPPGAGYSIAFSAAELEALSSRLFWSFGKCIYDPHEQQRVIEELVDFHIEKNSGRPDQILPASRPGSFIWSEPFGEALAFLAPFLKHEAFNEEVEWRLVSRPLPYYRFHHRPGRFHLIPYTTLPLSDLNTPVSIRKVTVGPTPHPDLACGAVRSLLEAASVTCEIERSKIPFRGW